MTRDVSGNYTLPGAVNPVVPGTAITDTWGNTTLNDVAVALTDSLSRSGKGGMTVQLKIADGTVSLPSIGFSNETTSGFYRASAGVVRLGVLGTPILEFTPTNVAALVTLSALTPATNINTTQVPTTAWVNAFYAPALNPTLTGTVTVTGTVSLPATTSIGAVSALELSYIDGVITPIQPQLDLKAPLASPTFTGAVTVPTEVPASNNTRAATTAYVTNALTTAAFAAALPGQTGNAGKIVTTNGTAASWSDIKTVGGVALLGAGNIPIVATLPRSARTTNTILGLADASTLIDITSGAFTQTFAAAATLASGWIVYIRNAGTGEITLDPNAAELIDGLTSYIMYPGEVRIVQCDGTALRTVILQGGTFRSSVSGNWTKPPGYLLFDIRVTGSGSSGSGGGGGGSGTGVASQGGATGGGGGAAGQNGVTARKRTSAASLPSTVAYLIGAATPGGAGAAGGTAALSGAAGVAGNNGTNGVAGNTSSFGAIGAAVRIDAAGGTVPGANSRGQGGSAGNATAVVAGGTIGNNNAAVIAFLISASDQTSTATANGANGGPDIQRTTLTAPGTAGSAGGITSVGVQLSTGEPGGVGGAGSAATPTAGSVGTKPVSTATGIGGAGGGGGGGSASAGGANAATGAGGNGGAGGDGGVGEVEIIGVV